MKCITWRPTKVQISLPVPDFSWVYTNPIWVQLMNTHGKYTKTWHSTWPFQIDQACLVYLNPWPVFNAFFYQIKNNFQMCQQTLCRIYKTWTMDKAGNIVSAFKVLFLPSNGHNTYTDIRIKSLYGIWFSFNIEVVTSIKDC